MDRRELVSFFEPDNTYAKAVPGTNVKLLFKCGGVMIHPDTGKRYASGFQSYEGSGFWKPQAVTFRDFDGWVLHEAAPKNKDIFEAGFTYGLVLDNGHVGSEFQCVGVGPHPKTGNRCAVGYLRHIKVSGFTTAWEPTVKIADPIGPNFWKKLEKE